MDTGYIREFTGFRKSTLKYSGMERYGVCSFLQNGSNEIFMCVYICTYGKRVRRRIKQSGKIITLGNLTGGIEKNSLYHCHFSLNPKHIKITTF